MLKGIYFPGTQGHLVPEGMEEGLEGRENSSKLLNYVLMNSYLARLLCLCAKYFVYKSCDLTPRRHWEESIFFFLFCRWEKWDSNDKWITQDHATAMCWNWDFSSGVCSYKSCSLHHYILLSLHTTCNNFAIVLSWWLKLTLFLTLHMNRLDLLPCYDIH